MTQSVRAPELETSLGWLNTDRPLRFDGELRGQVVVLDFWTYCCINCMHILPDLAWLEEKYAAQPVSFIGVHSAKFDNEASRETIRSAILRYEIKHPVVIDERMRLWRAYAVRSWPTLVVVDPQGYVVGVAAGEGNRATIDRMIEETLAQHRSRGTLAAGPLKLRREAVVPAASGLKFPGKVLADARLCRLFVADSNHNRIVIAELPGESGRARVLAVVGTGRAGRDDGPADRATFNHPQGMAVGHGNLYVADTDNHLIRAVSLKDYSVRTIVGTGEMVYDRAGGGMGTEQPLNTPWDLTIEGSTLYCAMAGQHQIWRIDLPVGFARALAGTGRENLADGPTELAALSQPSGICVMGGNIYFADSEVSAIRGIDMAAEQVFTVIGEGLFVFGDVDGDYAEARLQHPLGVCAYGSSLLVADTYNHKIKLVDPKGRTARTLFGTGRPGVGAEGRPAFNEPGGLSAVGDECYVADTNNHRVVRVYIKSGAWCEVVLDGLERPGQQAGDEGGHVERLAVPTAKVALGQDVRLLVDVQLPAGMHVSAEAPWSVRVRSNGATLVQQTGKGDQLPLTVNVPGSAVAAGQWRIDAALTLCSDGDRGLCMPVQLAWALPVEAGAEREVRVRGITGMP